MLIHYSDGSFVEGVIQRLDGACLRVAAAGVDDEVEFRLIDREWFSESGSPVTFEFPVRVATELFHIETVDEHGKCIAGGDCVLRRVWLEDSPPAN